MCLMSTAYRNHRAPFYKGHGGLRWSVQTICEFCIIIGRTMFALLSKYSELIDNNLDVLCFLLLLLSFFLQLYVNEKYVWNLAFSVWLREIKDISAFAQEIFWSLKRLRTVVDNFWKDIVLVMAEKLPSNLTEIYSVRGLERSELGGSHGCPGRLWDRFLWQVCQNDSRHDALNGV